jgi:uncharacterized PurR-regulated membrane protein YhhQ (DUF165 family)
MVKFSGFVSLDICANEGEFMGSAIIYVSAVLLANLTATWFVPLPIFGQVAVGTFVFGFTFTQRDRMHARGRKFVYTVIGISALLSVALSALGQVPPRIILASVVAILLAETVDTEIYQRLLAKSWWHRVLTSNAVSIPLDSLFFNLVAFLGVFEWRLLVSIIFGEIVVKFLVGAVSAIWRGKEVRASARQASSTT